MTREYNNALKDDSYRTQVIAMIDKQIGKGINKYGFKLEDNGTLTSDDKANHLIEELIDGIFYSLKIKDDKKGMTFDEYQAIARRTSDREREVQWRLANAGMGLAGEAGEAVDEVKKVLFHEHDFEKSKIKLVKELGDVLWYASEMADVLGVSLEDVARQNNTKLLERYPEGFSPEKSKDRMENKMQCFGKFAILDKTCKECGDVDCRVYTRKNG